MEAFDTERNLAEVELESRIGSASTLEGLIDALQSTDVLLDSRGLRETQEVIESIEEIFGDVKLAKFEKKDIGPIADMPKLRSVPEIHGIRSKVVALLEQLP